MGFCTWYDSISEKLGQSWAQTNNISVKKRQHLLAKLEKFLLNIALAVGQPLLLYLLHKTARYTVHKACCLWNDEILSNEIAAFFPACIEKKSPIWPQKKSVCIPSSDNSFSTHLEKGESWVQFVLCLMVRCKRRKKEGCFSLNPTFYSVWAQVQITQQILAGGKSSSFQGVDWWEMVMMSSPVAKIFVRTQAASFSMLHSGAS